MISVSIVRHWKSDSYVRRRLFEPLKHLTLLDTYAGRFDNVGSDTAGLLARGRTEEALKYNVHRCGALSLITVGCLLPSLPAPHHHHFPSFYAV